MTPTGVAQGLIDLYATAGVSWMRDYFFAVKTPEEHPVFDITPSDAKSANCFCIAGGVRVLSQGGYGKAEHSDLGSRITSDEYGLFQSAFVNAAKRIEPRLDAYTIVSVNDDPLMSWPKIEAILTAMAA